MKFRIVIPVIYVAVALLPIVGMIMTIAEGPNPLGFFSYVSEPGFRIVELLARFLHTPSLDDLSGVLIGILINGGIYFLLGYAVDKILERRRES